jgi:hypothetical protein
MGISEVRQRGWRRASFAHGMRKIHLNKQAQVDCICTGIRIACTGTRLFSAASRVMYRHFPQSGCLYKDLAHVRRIRPGEEL